MRSGKKILRGLLLAADRPRTQARMIQKLKPGSLRSLILHLAKQPSAAMVSEQILALAMCEVTRRFLEKGKEIL